jgi:hypothetical protein
VLQYTPTRYTRPDTWAVPHTNLGITSTGDVRPKTAPQQQNKYRNCEANFIEDFNILKVHIL